jgi:hypothetical protein
MMESKQPLAKITYAIDEEGDVIIDVSLDDYSENTLNKLSTLIASIPEPVFQIQMMNIIKDAFVAEGKDELFITLMTSILEKQQLFADSIQSAPEEKKGEVKDKDSPLIQPTDLL